MDAFFKLGDKFSSFTEVLEKCKEFEKKYSVCLIVMTSRLLKHVKCKNPIKPELATKLVYYDLTLGCIHT